MLNKTNTQCNMIIIIMVTVILEPIDCYVIRNILGSCTSINFKCTFLWALLSLPLYLYISILR